MTDSSRVTELLNGDSSSRLSDSKVHVLNPTLIRISPQHTQKEERGVKAWLTFMSTDVVVLCWCVCVCVYHKQRLLSCGNPGSRLSPSIKGPTCTCVRGSVYPHAERGQPRGRGLSGDRVTPAFSIHGFTSALTPISQ